MITCCKECVAPKRYPGCHGHCAEYLGERKEYDKYKARDDLKRKVKNDIYQQRSDNVARAMRHHGRKK